MEDKEIILVTGSSGLIGSAVIRRLTKEFQIIGFDRAGDPHPPIEAECVCVDLAEAESVQAGLRRVRYAYGERIASVIHLAAYYDFSGEPSPKYDEITVDGTQRLLRGLQEFDIGQFIFSSTMLVHAPSAPGQPINEEWPLAPKWAYPESKVKTEQLIHAERGDTPTVLLRIAGVYDDRCDSIPLAHQIQRIYERQLTSHVFPGELAHGQSFLHLDDLVDACVRVVHRRTQLPPELVLLLGEPEVLSYDELQRTFGRLIHGEEWKTYPIPKALAKAGSWLQNRLPLGEEPFIKPRMIDLADDHYELDISRARRVLDWAPQHSLRDTLPLMIDALKTDPSGWYRGNKLKPPVWLKTAAMHSPEHQSTQKEQQPQRPEAAQDQTAMPAMQHGAMAERGVTRPQMAMPMTNGHGEMTDEERQAMQREHHHKTLWIYLLIVLLGVWLISSPFTFGYNNVATAESEVARVTAERGLPSLAGRGLAMTWSDIISGVLLVVLGWLSLHPRRLWAPWAACLVGVWLLFAPLIFWAPTAAAYLNDSLIGALIIALTVLIPGMPGMILMMQSGPETPPGWTYNPSSWLQRTPIIALGWVGFFLSRWLAAYQLGYIASAWDPFFGPGTMQILDSDVSRAWPISDAGLGTVAYTIEALMGYMGGASRWRTMPWMVTFFGILVVPLGVVSITLVILQPVAVGTWCTLCLITALAMLIMIPLTLDEVIAMGQFVVQRTRAGHPFWRTFWMGGTVEGGGEDARSPHFIAPLRETGPAMVWGVNVPWPLLLSAVLGVWLMAAPAVFGSQGAAADSDHLVGALVATVAVTAMAEVARTLRFVNIPLGAWFIVAPWLLGGATTGSTWNDILVGAILILLSFPRGQVRERYGSWDRYIV